MVALGPEARDRHTVGDAGVAVCPSGNLANIYFTREPGRLSLEYLVATYPGLVEGLASHPGVGFVLVFIVFAYIGMKTALGQQARAVSRFPSPPDEPAG